MHYLIEPAIPKASPPAAKYSGAARPTLSSKDTVLHFTTLDRFVSSHSDEIEELGNIGTNKGFNRFSLRSKKKVQGQWQLYCLVHNIEKLANYGRMAA